MQQEEILVFAAHYSKGSRKRKDRVM